MDRGAWKAAVHGVTKSQTLLSDFTFTFHFHALEKEIATHSSILAWRIPGMGEPPLRWAAIYGVAQSQTRLKWLSSSSSRYILIISNIICSCSCSNLSDSCDSTGCSPLGSSVRGILQVRILEWVAMPSSRGSS